MDGAVMDGSMDGSVEDGRLTTPCLINMCYWVYAPLEFSIETLKQVFDMIDKDRDGEISMAELSQAWMNENISERLGKTWLAYQKNKKLSRVDTDGIATHIQNIFLRIEADRNEPTICFLS